MSEFEGYCPCCGNKEDITAHKPCIICGSKMKITAMDGKNGNEDIEEEDCCEGD